MPTKDELSFLVTQILYQIHDGDNKAMIINTLSASLLRAGPVLTLSTWTNSKAVEQLNNFSAGAHGAIVRVSHH